MSTFMDAMDTSADNYTFTEKGQLSFTPKGVDSNLLALYFKLVRGATEKNIVSLTAEVNANPAFLEDLVVLTFQTRDVRGGKGERQLFYILFNYLYTNNSHDIMKRLLALVPVYGSFKDLNILWEMADKDCHMRHVSNPIKQDILDIYTLHLRQDELNSSNDSKLSLAAKWAPRESGHFTAMARALANNYLKDGSYSQKKVYTSYRKMVSALNKRLNTTEIHMAGKSWQDINPGHVPARCLLINKDAFQNRIHSGEAQGDQRSREEDRIVCAEKFKKHLDDGSTVHGGILYPSDIIKRYSTDFDAVLEAQWKDIASEYEVLFTEKISNGENVRNTIPIIDVSGSMTCNYGGTVAPIDAAVGLGILLAGLSSGPYKGRAITFSDKPEWIRFKGCSTLKDQIHAARSSSWGMTTNLYNVFNLILKVAVKKKVSEAELANMDLIILSDMQFDTSQRNGDAKGKWKTTLQNIETLYAVAGYHSVPHIIFWNLHGRTMDFPEQANTPNVTMVSGFSPSAAKTLLTEGVGAVKKEKKTPSDTLREILDDARYDPVREAFRSPL